MIREYFYLIIYVIYFGRISSVEELVYSKIYSIDD